MAQHTTICELHFGDDRNKIQDKLTESQLFTSTLSENLFGRTGLNGVFRCKTKILDEEYSLYFGMQENALEDLHFRSTELPLSEYSDTIKDLWVETSQLVTHIYGAPLNANEIPKHSEIPNDKIIYSHTWEYREFYILCGVGKENGKFYSVVTFTTTEPILVEE